MDNITHVIYIYIWSGMGGDWIRSIYRRVPHLNCNTIRVPKRKQRNWPFQRHVVVAWGWWFALCFQLNSSQSQVVCGWEWWGCWSDERKHERPKRWMYPPACICEYLKCVRNSTYSKSMESFERIDYIYGNNESNMLRCWFNKCGAYEGMVCTQ